MSQLRAGVGASDTLFQHDRPNKPNRSKFDLSRITNFTADPGMIIPFDWFFCLPGDDVNIDFEMILDTLPLINPSLTSYKVVTHWYKIDCKHLWEGWQTFITKGRSGTESLQIPKINCDLQLNVSDDFDFGNNQKSPYTVIFDGNHSLQAFLGNPPSVNGVYNFNAQNGLFLVQSYLPYTIEPQDSGDINTDLVHDYWNIESTGLRHLTSINALPFMAYQNIVKYNYVNSNLLQNNHSLFPVEGDHNWFLKYNASVTNFIDYASNSEVTGNEVYSYDGVYSANDTVTRLDQLRYAMFDDDYFTTGLPWLQRGDVNELGVTVTFPEDFVELVHSSIDSLFYDGADSDVHTYAKDILAIRDKAPYGQDPDLKLVKWDIDDHTNRFDAIDKKLTAGQIALIKQLTSRASLQINSRNATASITANQLREMLAMSVWQERNARVDGSYNAMIYEHWMSNPHAEEHKPEYIGGTVDYVNFATILQSSATTSDSPLGSTAGRGSSGGNGHVGRIHCDDYAYIMGIMIIKPNTTYMQGVEHNLCCENVM